MSFSLSIAAPPAARPLVSRRPGILPVAALCLGLAGGFLPTRGMAAEPESRPEPTVPAAEADPLPALNARLQALLEQLRPYQLPHLEEISAAPAAATLEELVQRVDRVYAEAAFQSALRFWTYEDNLRALTDERVRLEEARVDHPKLEQELAAAPDRLKAEQDRSAALTAQAAGEERIAASLRDNAAALAEDFLAVRDATLGAVYYLLPASQRVAFHNGTQKNGNNPVYARLPEVESDHPGRPAPAPARPVPVQRENAGPTQPPPPVTGSIEEKFAAFADKQRALRNLANLLPPQQEKLAAARALADAQQGKNDELKARLAEFAAPLAQCAAATSQAEDRILTAQVNQKISAGNLLRLGTAALLWSYLRENVVAPQMEQFLEDNRLARKGPRGTALLDAINQRPQDFIPKSGTFENPQALGSLRLKLLDVETNLEVWAPATVTALEGGKISGSSELLARFFRNLGKPGVAILQATTDTLAPEQKKIALALLAHAPAE